MRSNSAAENLDFVDVNAADKEELRSSLPGIGPVLADRIVAFRHDHGPFASVTDLERVPGIGPRLAERLSERARVRDSVEIPRVMVSPLAPLSFGADGESKAHDGSASIPPRAHPEDVAGVVVSRAVSQFPPRRQRTAVAVVALVAVLAGTTAGAWLSERKAGAATATVDHEVQVLRIAEMKTHDELVRQADVLATTQETLSSAIEKQKVAEARTEERTAHIAKDMADLAEKTRQAQARTDAKVYRVDEAMKLIDWVTTKGYARQVASQGSPSVGP